MKLKTFAKAVGKVAGGLAATVAVTAGAYLPFVIFDAKKGYRDKCEYLLVLGGNVIGADTPSPQLEQRMRSAAQYLLENKETIAIPCGGCFREKQMKSEAAIIADYLISQGVEKERIILEDKSETTYQNFEFGTKIIKDHSGKELDEVSVAFLSSDYHMHRAALIAKQSGMGNCGRVSSPTNGKAIQRYFREYVVAYEVLYKAIAKNKNPKD